jgi:hypothetical protein
MMKEPCTHLHAWKTILSEQKHVCDECVKTGSQWVHLRTCQTCGITLCCDSSPSQHATHHARISKHPVVISSEPGERWAWCYADQQIMGY